MRCFLTTSALALATVLSTGFGTPARAGDPALATAISRHYDSHLGALFVHFHQNPELSYREVRTAARIARELKALGVQVTEGVGGTGVVGVIRNGSGPTVLLRADMDGLPVVEQSGLPYASTARQVDINGLDMPVMHACGHDVHITALVGTAKQLMDRRDQWAGTVVLVAQPAEERIGGARKMLDDGLYARFPKPDYALAFHVTAGLPAGQLLVEPGLIASSSDSVDITVHGIGAHGASPHMGRDPVVLGSQIVVALQTLVSREISPLEPGVVTVGAFHSGLKHNIISDRADLQITVRADSEKVRQTLLAGIRRIAENAGRMAGLPEDKLPTVTVSTESTPATINDDSLARRMHQRFSDHFGATRLARQPRQGMGAEDFAYFGADPAVKSLYFSVGGTPEAEITAAGKGGPPVPSHHSPLFRIAPQPSVTTGVEAMTVATLELLARP